MLQTMNENVIVSKIKCDLIKGSKLSQRTKFRKGKVKCGRVFFDKFVLLSGFWNFDQGRKNVRFFWNCLIAYIESKI